MQPAQDPVDDDGYERFHPSSENEMFWRITCSLPFFIIIIIIFFFSFVLSAALG